MGALLPFTLHPGVSAADAGALRPAAFRGSDSLDRAALVLDNQDALGLRLQMIAGAEESIILTSFDIRDCESARDIFAAPTGRLREGVEVRILWDGMSGMLHGRAPCSARLGSGTM
ncbi:MAG: hypothetical protein ACLSAF_20140 [Intestinimonas sp.]